ncbi:unnamed protein product [Lota lota]
MGRVRLYPTPLGPSSAAREVAALLSDKGKGRDRVPLPCCIDTHSVHSESSTAADALPGHSRPYLGASAVIKPH